MTTPVDYGDVQGLVRFGHGQLSEASFALVRVKSVEAARAWLRAAPVTSAEAASPRPDTALQVAFTAEGLEALGVPAWVRTAFSPEFLAGMTEESRSRRLGDVGPDAPAHWDWGGGSGSQERPRDPRVPHLLLMFYGEPAKREAFRQRHTGDSWRDGFELVRWLSTGLRGAVEPFGFADGISQPEVDWEGARDPARNRTEYGNVVALGEFLLGYRNEYGRFTDRPLVDPDPASAALLPALDAPDKRDVGRNGSYLVLRQLSQDVRGFWRFAYREAGGDLAAAEKLASLFVGRTRAGEPLATLRETGGKGQKRLNDFTFDDDPHGARCPIGAHIRRANPRNTDYPGRPQGLGRVLADLGFGPKGFADDLTSAVRFHRILRRGRAYGPWLPPEDAVREPPPDDPERGLHFVCLNANIARQFEFLQNAWMASTKFAGLSTESDPLVGNRVPIPGCPLTDGFSVPEAGGLRRRVAGLPRFVTVRGGAYFFLPGLRALRYLAGG